jgi:predicted lactoylglutathione lyase
MKIKSVAGVTLFVKDLNKSAEFYESLGFDKRKDKDNTITIYSNWFWVKLVSAESNQKSEIDNAQIIMYLGCDNVDEFYDEVISKGYKTLSEPANTVSGDREFVLLDPDGNKLAIFKRK